MSKGEIFDGETPPLADLATTAAKNVLRGFFTLLVGQVVTFDPVRQCADVQPLTQTVDANGLPVILPVIPCSQIFYIAGGGYSITHPLIPTDIVFVLFSTTALSQWAVSGSPVALPESARRGSLNDGIVIAGLRPQTLALANQTNPGMVIGKQVGPGSITIDPAGNLQLQPTALVSVGLGAQGVGSAELILVELVKIAAAINAIAPGSYTPPVTPAAIAVTKLKSD